MRPLLAVLHAPLTTFQGENDENHKADAYRKQATNARTSNFSSNEQQ
jgi:hypothetical protein